MIKLRKDVEKVDMNQKYSMLRVKEYIARWSGGQMHLTVDEKRHLTMR